MNNTVMVHPTTINICGKNPTMSKGRCQSYEGEWCDSNTYRGVYQTAVSLRKGSEWPGWTESS